jgi:hypothetical protein
MPGPAIAAIGGSIASAAIGSRAAKSASKSQDRAAGLQIDESRRQFNKIQGLLKPYVGAGNVALQAQLDLMGIGGTAGTAPQIESFNNGAWGAYNPANSQQGQSGFGDWTGRAVDGLFLGNGSISPSTGGQGGGAAQSGGISAMMGGISPTGMPQGQGGQFRVGGKQFGTYAEAEKYAKANMTGGMTADQAQKAAIDRLANGENFKALQSQGEYGLLANSAATGGLRGGDTAAALAQFRPQMLQSLIDRQLANLGGVAANGQNAAGQTGAAAMNTAGMVNAAYGDAGAAQAGRALAQGQAWSNAGSGIIGGLSGMAQPMQPGGGLWQRWQF